MTPRQKAAARPTEIVRVERAVVMWGAVYAVLDAIRLVAFTRGVAELDLINKAQAVTGVGVGLAAATTVPLLRSRAGRARWLWVLSGCAALSSWGLLQDLLTIASAQALPDLWGLGSHMLAGIGAPLLATAALRQWMTDRHHRRLCSPSARTARIAAVVGTVAFFPYAAMKTVWAAGGSFAGRRGAEVARISAENGASELWLALHSWGIDPTVLFACAGVLLLWALVLPWGELLPRWLLLTPAFIGAGTLVPYGVLGIGYLTLVTTDVLDLPAGDFPTPDDALLVAWIGLTSFAFFGTALAVIGWSFWVRTKTLSHPQTSHEHRKEASS